eukprot:scaffold1811_cov137-Skeletonema_marinoi.AAC.16
MMNSCRDPSLTNRCIDVNRNILDSMNTSSSHHDVRSTSFRPTRRTSKPSKQVFTHHQLFVIILLQILSITANAMIFLEDPIEALIYDSLPDPPDKDTISNGFLFNLTEGGLDNVRFKVGTPLHYLVLQSLDEEPTVVVTIESDEVPDEEMIDEGDTSLFSNVTSNDVNSTNATAALQYQNETAVITNDTDTNETITESANVTNSTTIFDQRTTPALPSWNETPVSSPVTSSSSASSSFPSREISGEYTEIVHHNPQGHNYNADLFITGSDGKTLTITELLGFFNDSKLVFTTETDEEYVYYDSRQARFGSDLGPKGKAAFVNIMLPPRWGEVELTVDEGEMGEEGVDTTVVIDGVDVEGNHDNATNHANGTIDVTAIGAPQDDLWDRMRGLEDEDHLLGFRDENQTNATEMVDAHVYASNQTQANTTEGNQTVDNVTIDTATASINETVNTTINVNEEEFSGQFDTHISSYFCLDDFVSWRSKLSDAIVPPASVLPSSNMIHSTRGIALMVQRGRCSFEDKAKLAMVFNDILSSENKSNRIDHIIVYNNGTIDKNNNGTDGEEQLVEMLQVPLWNDTFYQSSNAVNMGMLYITTESGLDLLKRMSERQNEMGISPYLDMMSWIRGRHLISESSKDDGQHVGSVAEESTVTVTHDDSVTNGWFFPATLTRFCLSCGIEMDYGFYPFSPMEGGGYRPGEFGPTNWPNSFSDDYYQPQRWVEMIRRLMIAILVILLVGPMVLATHRWHTVGGTIRMTTDENGRRRVRIINPTLEVFVEGVPDTVETNGTKLDRAQVFSLPEIVYGQPSSVSDSNTGDNEDVSTHVGDDNNAQNGASPDSFQENGNPRNQDDTPSPTAQITPPGSDAGTGDMFASSSCCPICIEEFEPGEKLRVLPCKHLFHIDCIMPWLTERQGCCPQCRTPVLPEEFQRSRRSSPRRSGSALGRFRRERRQEREESDSALTPARLFTEIQDDLGGDDTTTTDTAPQESRGNVVPYGVEENDSHSNAGDENPSSPEIMEQGLMRSGEAPAGNHIDITATVSADDIEISFSASSPVEVEGDRLADNANTTGVSEGSDTVRDADDDPSDNDDGYAAFLRFLKTPSILSQENGGSGSRT